MAKPKWTATAVTDALRVAYGVAGSELVTDEWAFLTEVPLRTARVEEYDASYWNTNQRTIDVMLVRAWSGKPGHRRIAIEVKVSRSDYRNETDVKRAPAEVAAHQTYYAAPAGLIAPADLPKGWGLLEVHTDRRSYEAAKGWDVGTAGVLGLVKCRARAPERTPSCDMEYLTSAFARRASRAEERIRRGEDEAAMVPGLRASVESLEGKLARRDEALRVARSRLAAVKSLALAVEGGQDCADCGHPIALDTRDRLRGNSWRHKDAAHEVACHAARTEADRLARESQFGTRYMRGWAPPVEPKALREQAADLPDAALD